ncbi:MAG: hypothetical protein U5K53_00190 [Halanaerobiales bacterium]|nr:hypothetical protein [Halanaerobiales bacterium]
MVNKDTILELKETGLSDQDIFDINQVVSYFNYVNRIVEGLGVQLESEEN